MTHPRTTDRRAHPPTTHGRLRSALAGVAATAIAGLALATLAVAGPAREPHAHAHAQADAPPTTTLAVGAERWDGRVGTHIWGGLAVDYPGVMTAREPFTATAGVSGSLSIAGVDVAPVDLSLTWYDVTGIAPDLAGDDWAAWRPTGTGSPVAGVSPTLQTQTVALPSSEGRWLLYAIGLWEGDGRGDVHWGWLIDVVDDGEADYAGTFAGGFEMSDYLDGADACPGVDEAWWLVGDDGSEFFDAYRAILLQETGLPFVQGFPVEARFRGRLSPPGQYGHLGAYPREITVTRLIAMSPTLRCGMDKPDLALLDAEYVVGCDGPELRFTLANLGSQPITSPVRVEARDADGALVDAYRHPGPLEPGQRVPFDRLWRRPGPTTAPVELVTDELPGIEERYLANNRATVAQLPPPPCLPPTPEPEGHPVYVPSAGTGTVDGPSGLTGR